MPVISLTGNPSFIGDSSSLVVKVLLGMAPDRGRGDNRSPFVGISPVVGKRTIGATRVVDSLVRATAILDYLREPDGFKLP